MYSAMSLDKICLVQSYIFFPLKHQTCHQAAHMDRTNIHTYGIWHYAVVLFAHMFWLIFLSRSVSFYLVAPSAEAALMNVIWQSIVTAHLPSVRTTSTYRTAIPANKARLTATMASASTMTPSVRPYLAQVSSRFCTCRAG